MIEAYDEYKTSILGVQEVDSSDMSKYGIVSGSLVSDRIYTVSGLVEKPSVSDALSNVAILGRYIINPSIFDILADTEPGKGGEIQLTDSLQVLATRESMYAYNFEGRRYDVGDKQGFLEATVEYAFTKPELKADFLNYLVGVIDMEMNR